MLSFLTQNAGWFAYLAAAASIFSFIALFIFFAGVPVFGPINDAGSVFQMLFLVPVALALHQVFRQSAPALSLAATAAAVLAMIAIAGLQLALVLGFVRFDQTLRPVLALGVVIGLWWLAVGALSINAPVFPAGLGWAGVLSGASFVAIAIGFWIGGQQHPLAAMGFLVGAIASSVWAIWLGRLLLSGRIPILL